MIDLNGADLLRNRRVRGVVAVALIAVIVAAVWILFPHIHRKPPSIFDTPVDGVLSYLSTDDFNALSVEERMNFLQGVLKKFSQMSQADSAVASSFLAGLTGPANEKLVDNARILGKDIIVQGAAEYLAISDQKARDDYIDKWLIKWTRFAEESTGRPTGRSDDEILHRMSDDARRDAGRNVTMDAIMAQQIIDFWNRDVASVASPKEQSQIYQFIPALRNRVLNRGK